MPPGGLPVVTDVTLAVSLVRGASSVGASWLSSRGAGRRECEMIGIAWYEVLVGRQLHMFHNFGTVYEDVQTFNFPLPICNGSVLSSVGFFTLDLAFFISK